MPKLRRSILKKAARVSSKIGRGIGNFLCENAFPPSAEETPPRQLKKPSVRINLLRGMQLSKKRKKSKRVK